MIFGGIPPLAPHPPRGALEGGWGYPKLKMKVIFEFPTIKNPRIDITHDIWWYTPSSPPAPPGGRPWGVPRGLSF